MVSGSARASRNGGARYRGSRERMPCRLAGEIIKDLFVEKSRPSEMEAMVMQNI